MTASLSLPIGVNMIPDWIAEWFTALDPGHCETLPLTPGRLRFLGRYGDRLL